MPGLRAAVAMSAVMLAGTLLVGAAAQQQQERLRCAWPEGRTPGFGSAALGPAGGTLRVRNNEFEVPANALTAEIAFTMRELGGDTVGVLITPSVSFARPATVRIDVGTARCMGDVDRSRYSVWRFPEGGGAGERLPTQRPALRNTMVAELSANSYIIIAD